MEIIAVETQMRALLKTVGYLPTGTPVEPAPYSEDLPYPAVIYKLLTPEADTIMIGGNVVMSTLDYLVVAETVGQNSYDLIPYVNGIRQALQGNGGTNTYGTVFTFQRIRPFSLAYRAASGKTMQQSGYVFQCRAQGIYT